jgi:hypothetical protein
VRKQLNFFFNSIYFFLLFFIVLFHFVIFITVSFWFMIFFFVFDDILQGAGVLQHLPGRACWSSTERILMGSNDLHRFWEFSYVGHAVNMLKIRGSP